MAGESSLFIAPCSALIIHSTHKAACAPRVLSKKTFAVLSNDMPRRQADGAERSSFAHVIGIVANVSASPSGALTLVHYDDMERGKGRNGLIVNLVHVVDSPESLDVCALVPVNNRDSGWALLAVRWWWRLRGRW